MDFVAAIRERRDRAVQRALSLLDHYRESDAATRRSVLPIAALALGDRRVAERWIAVLAAETDPGLRRSLLAPLAALDFRQVPRDEAAIALLAGCLDQPDAREWALHLLSRLAPQDPRIARRLISAIGGSRDDAFVRSLLAVLLDLHDPPAEVHDLFAARLHEVDANVKLRMVRRLLDHDRLPLEAAQKLLAPTESAAVKLAVLDHWIDRSIRVEAPLLAVLRRDPDPRCRYAAVLALTETGALPDTAIEALLDAFAREREDRVKAALLAPLVRAASDDPRVAVLCREAIRLPDPELRRWGAHGILALPATPEHASTFAASAALLLAPDLPSDLCLRLAHKLAGLPDQTAALQAALADAAKRATDERVRRACEAVGDEAISAGIERTPGVDWDDWLHRAEVEHRADGIFPALFEHYDEAPDAARRVLKALLLPQCAGSLYSAYGYEVGEWAILDFLDRKNAIDDDVSRFCVGRILTQDAGTPNGLLEFLPSNPGFAGLREAFWSILAKRADADPALLRRILLVAHGDEDAAVRACAERISRTRGAGALRPYLRLVTGNLGWDPARELLERLARHPDLDADFRQEMLAAREQLGIVEPPNPPAQGPTPGPGFADD